MRPHQTIASYSGRALCRPRTKPSPVVVAAPCAGLAPVIPQARRDVRSCVRKRRTSERLSMSCLSTFVNDRTRLGCSLVRTLERASLLSEGGLLHALHIIRLFAACEAGTRRGHYSGYSLIVRWLRTLERASLLSGGGLLHALHIIRLFAACEAGTRHGHYSGYSLLDRRLRTLERASLRLG